MNKKINHNIAILVILLAILVAIISVFIYCQNNKPCYDFLEEKMNFKVKSIQRKDLEKNNSEMVGNDRDKYGCIASAGYVWCESKEKCIRPWEEECEIKKIISEIVEIDNFWNKYINYDLGFEINYPKKSFDSEVEIIEDGDVVYISSDYQKEMIQERENLDDFEKVRGITYALLIKDVYSEKDLEQFIKKRHYPACNLGELLFDEELNAYNVRIDAGEIDFDNPDSCFMNFAYNIIYSKEKNKVVAWDMGQAVNFWYNEKAYDMDINKSFKFLD